MPHVIKKVARLAKFFPHLFFSLFLKNPTQKLSRSLLSLCSSAICLKHFVFTHFTCFKHTPTKLPIKKTLHQYPFSSRKRTAHQYNANLWIVKKGEQLNNSRWEADCGYKSTINLHRLNNSSLLKVCSTLYSKLHLVILVSY